MQRSGLSLVRVAVRMALVVGLSAVVHAAPVVGKIVPVRQPDGSFIELRVWGDEFYTVAETLDGFTVTRDPLTGLVCYARVADDGSRLISTGLPAADPVPANLDLRPHLRISDKARAAAVQAARADFARRAYEGPLAPPAALASTRGPTTGVVQGIVLLIDFSDDVGTISPSVVESYCNLPGYSGYNNNGSVRDYFHDVSDGLLEYTNFVPTAYYRAQHPKSYYTDPNISYGTRARELIIEALQDLDSNGMDFSQFDADNDGIIDGLNCFYAGYSNSAWAEGLWPHAWTVYFSADGVSTSSYQMTDMGNNLELGTFCHENGHMLMGWPDLYDYDYDSTGVGRFCLMCYGGGGTNPVEPCAWMKYDAGWANVTLLTTPQTGLIAPIGVNTMYKYAHPSLPNEFYLVENRHRTGRDSSLPDAGLAIWHIDEYGSNNNQEQTPSSHYLVTLVQADGDWDLENDRNYGDSTDLYGAPAYTSCTPSTYPNTNWWSGAASGLAIVNISSSASVMTFDFVAEVDCNGNGTWDYIDIDQGTSIDCNGNGVPDECDTGMGGASQDCDNDGVPDECQADCNSNGVNDACEGPAGAGVKAFYFDNMMLAGTPQVQIDNNIYFDWGSGAPHPELGSDLFSIRWIGSFETVDRAGTYRFYTNTDDGVRLWIDGLLIIDQWVDQAPTEYFADVTLDPNSTYTLRMEYYENGGGAVAQLFWKPPGLSKTLIPTLSHGNDCNENGVPDECDIDSGESLDANGNSVPDECEAAPVCPGDANCDTFINFRDIDYFVAAQNDNVSAWTALFGGAPMCDFANNDVNGDGFVNFRDIDAFVALQNTTCE